jgi:hypothetical protein
MIEMLGERQWKDKTSYEDLAETYKDRKLKEEAATNTVVSSGDDAEPAAA